MPSPVSEALGAHRLRSPGPMRVPYDGTDPIRIRHLAGLQGTASGSCPDLDVLG